MIYEDDLDRAEEARVADRVRRAWGCQLLRLPHMSEPGDYLLHNGQVALALLEIKRRTTPHDQYETYMVSAKKIETMTRAANRMRVEALLVVEFSDGLRWVNAHEMSRAPLHFGGRHDRPEEGTSMEPCHHIPHTALRGMDEQAKFGENLYLGDPAAAH